MKSAGTILLADDEDTFSKATRTLIEGEGFSCQTVGTGTDLSEALEEKSYDLLITDLKMPGNRVMELVAKVQETGTVLPVIIVTGYPTVPTAVEAVRLNVLDYLIKPIEFPVLLQCIRRGLRWRQGLLSISQAYQLGQSQLDHLKRVETTWREICPLLDGPVPDSPFNSSLLSAIQQQLQQILEAVKGPTNVLPSKDCTHDDQNSRILIENLRLRQAIIEAIRVLQKTKGSFRSRELASLRQGLQELLQGTPLPGPQIR